MLNAIGALTLVYAFRYGKAIVVAPLTNAGAPLVTAVISLIASRASCRGRSRSSAWRSPLVASVLLAIEPDAADDASRRVSPDPRVTFHYASFSCVSFHFFIS